MADAPKDPTLEDPAIVTDPPVDPPADPAPERDPNELPTGFRGRLMPVNTRSGDGRMFMLAEGEEPAVRPLPIAFQAQEKLSEGHDGAIVVGLLTRVWLQDGFIWGEGPFDLQDEDAAKWAAKVGRGTAGWVSIDLSDIGEVEEIPIGADGQPITDEVFAAYESAWSAWEAAGDPEALPPEPPEVKSVELRVSGWKVMNATLVSGPAFEDAKVEPVYGEEFTPVDATEALVASAAEHSGAMIALVPSEADCARLAVEGYELPEDIHLTLAYLGEAADWPQEAQDAIDAAIRELSPAPMPAEVKGYAAFNVDSDEPCAVYLVEADGLSDLRDATMGVLEETPGLPQIPKTYDGFIPHITIGYGMDLSLLTEFGPITFDRIRIAFAGVNTDIPMGSMTSSLVASAHVFASADFEIPEADEPTDLTVDDDGRVYGHLAAWTSCHIGIPGCTTPPVGQNNYDSFHQGSGVRTERGKVKVGRITIGTGHARDGLTPRQTMAHYDNTGAAVAVVRCRDGKYGPWLSGHIIPGVADEKVEQLSRSAVSGDWRGPEHALALVAVLAVNVPGFPIPHARSMLTASGMQSLTAAGIVMPSRKNHLRKISNGARDIREIVRETLREFNAEKGRQARRDEAQARVRKARVESAARIVKSS